MSLKALAARALPEPLRTVYRHTGDVSVTSLAAETYANVVAKGRVGRHPACLAVLPFDGGFRVDCMNNPEFWLELREIEDIDADIEYTARGRCDGGRAAAGRFVVRRDGGNRIRVDHSTEPWFWVEIHLGRRMC